MLRRIILSVEELTTKLERASSLRCTNWQNVRAHYDRVERQLEKQPVEQAVLSISMIQSEVLLGAGGFGAVYKARFGGKIPCTVKLVRDDMFDFDKYACVDKIVASMTNHPLLVKYYACFAIRQGFVTVMEYIRGVDLDKLVHAERGLPMKLLRPLCAQLGMATQYLHFKGFIHRDIKPSNLIISHNCSLKMIDFDTVKVCIGMFPQKRLKSYFRRTFTEFNDRESAGTLNYFPPEFFKVVPYGRAVDWWAVGATIYEICFGRTPFRGADDAQLEQNITSVKYKFPKAAHQTPYLMELKDLVSRLLKQNASARLCSRSYSEYLLHPFFKGLDLSVLEKGELDMHYEGVARFMQPSNDGLYSPKPNRSLQAKRVEYLEPEKQTDAKVHAPLFTFVSTPFQIATAKLKRNEEIQPNDINVTLPELGIAVFTVDKALQGYKFEKFLEK